MAQWNVLAEELVAYPPPGGTAAARGQVTVLPAAPLHRPVRTGAGTSPIRQARTASPGLRANVAVQPPARAVPARPRGLRRLLPGAATLAALGALWLGAGALSAAHQPTTVVIPGSVRSHGGYLYVVEPGDSLWEIASRVQPGGDPRPLVYRLQAQLHGKPLLPGDRLILP